MQIFNTKGPKILAIYPGLLSTKDLASQYPNVKIADLSEVNSLSNIRLGNGWLLQNQGIMYSADKLFTRIKYCQEPLDYILVKADTEMDKVLWSQEEVPYLILYPKGSRKQSYLQRLKDQGYPQYYIEYVDQHWQTFISAISGQPHTIPFVVGEDEDKLFDLQNREVRVSQ